MADTTSRVGGGVELNTLELEAGVLAPNRLSPKEIDKMLRQTVSVPGCDFPRGYPRQAAFQSSEPSWSIYRAFGYLHSRVILELQEELRELEEELKDLDDDHAFSNDSAENLRVSSRIADRRAAQREHQSQQSERVILSARAIILAKIEDRLVRYDKMLIKAREMVEFQRPNDRDWLSLRTWFWNTKPLSNEREELFVQLKDDLVTLKPRDDSGRLDSWIDHAVMQLPRCMSEFFTSSGPKKFDDGHIYYTHAGRIEKLTTLVVVLIIIFLLATPVFIMYRITWNNTRSSTFLNIGLLIVFSLLFAASMGLLTKAKRAELFAATAAYCAVLIVFIGNFSSNAT